MTKPTVVPGIPKPPAKLDAETRNYLESIAEAMEIRLGRRGHPEDRAITLRELINSGLAVALKQAPFDPNIPDSPPGFGPVEDNPSTTPPVPVNFTANGAYSVVNLFWKMPLYPTHALTEIWRHDSDVIGDAQLVGVTSGRAYIDPIGGGLTRYYWIRFVNEAGVTGPFNSSTGTQAVTATDVAHELEVLAGAITASELATSLATPIGNLPADTTAQINSLQSQINGLSNVSAWASGTSYNTFDLVTYSGNLYEAQSAHTASSSNAPSGTTANNSTWNFVGAYSSLASAVAANASDISDINYLSTSSNSAAAVKIASLDATVNDSSTGVAATASAVSGLTTTVNTNTSNIASAASDITALENTVNDSSTGVSANATAVTGLDSRVTVVEGDITSQSSDITALQNTVNDGTTGVAATASALSALTTTVSNNEGTLNTAVSDITSLNTTVGNNSTSISTNATSINGLEAQYTVKIDNNGHISGFGLSSTTSTAGPTSAFIVRADRFAVIDPADTGDGLGTTSPSTDNVPFIIDSGNTFLRAAMIQDASITNAKIGSLNADKITAGELDTARIATNSIEASKLKIDGNVLTENSSGELILQTGISSTTGVRFENLSFDAVGLIASAATSGTVSVNNQAYYTHAQFTASMPYAMYLFATLPLVLNLDVPASSIRESGTYFLDFGGTPVGSIPNNPNYVVESALVLDIYRKDPTATIYSINASKGSVLQTGASSHPLGSLHEYTTVYLDSTKDYRFRMFGFFKNMSTNSSGAQGFSAGYIRLMRLHKTT